MRAEHVFTVDGAVAVPATPVTLLEADLQERQHLQEWVLAHPEILGDERLLTITSEFGNWQTHSGQVDRDRFDVLALDADGRLLVAELKRGPAPDTVLNQTLNYAARVSRFSLDDAIRAHRHYLGPETTEQEAAARLRAFAPDISDETLATGPRIVVLAGGFPAAVTNTALYLLGFDVPLSLLRFELYRTASGELIFTTSQVLPIPSAETLMVKPRSGVATRVATQRAQAERKANSLRVQLLADSPSFPDGQELRVVVPSSKTVDTQQVNAWLDADPLRRQAFWRHQPDGRCLIQWRHDGGTYELSTEFPRAVVQAATGQQGAAVWGFTYLEHLGDGRTLRQHLVEIERRQPGRGGVPSDQTDLEAGPDDSE